jgi:hypothetical protein
MFSLGKPIRFRYLWELRPGDQGGQTEACRAEFRPVRELFHVKHCRDGFCWVVLHCFT